VTAAARRRVSMVTLGCARNEVDSEELAGRLDAAGWELSDEAPDVVVVNTCGFVEQAKKDSIDTLLAASDTGAKVVAVGLPGRAVRRAARRPAPRGRRGPRLRRLHRTARLAGPRPRGGAPRLAHPR
jgi:tRNA A37 methylthiotransferase MiaB